MEIDHVVLAARTKADAEQVLSRAGLGVARGRTIPGLGLSNLVVPLRHGQLLEIHYPNGEAPAPGAPPLLEFDEEALAAHPSQPWSRWRGWWRSRTPSGCARLPPRTRCPWSRRPRRAPGFPPYVLAGFGANFDRRFLPCLIHWPEGHPVLSAAHRHQPVGITGIDVAGPADVIEGWCGGKPNGMHAVPGTAGPLRVQVGFADGAPLTLGLAE